MLLPLLMNLDFAGGRAAEAPGAPGREYTCPLARTHYTAPNNRPHYTVPINPPHFTLPDEDD